MNHTTQTESFTMYAYRKLHEGFTLIELIIVMVILGILAAVAVPKMGNIISKSSDAAADAVIAQLESAAEIYALDQVILTGSKSYPSNPFNELEKKPSGYSNSFSTEEGSWWMDLTNIYHRGQGDLHTWSYNPNTGEITKLN